MKSDWKKFKISDFAKRSKIPVKVEDENFYKRITIKMHGLGIVLRDEIRGYFIGTKNQFYAKKGQFLLSKIDARNGAFGILPDNLDGALISNSFQAYNLDKKIINTDFLNYLTKTHSFIDFCNKASEGTTNRRNLDDNKFLSLEIPLPPLSEQKRIVKKIKEIEERVEALKKENSQRVQEIQIIIDSWINKKFIEIPRRKIDQNKDIIFCSRGKSPEYSQNSEIICLNQKCNRWDKIDLSYAKKVSKKWLELIPQKMLTREGDILINSTGDGTVGRASLIKKEFEGLIYDSHMLLIRFNKSRIDPYFFVKIFNSSLGQKQVEDNISAKTTKQTELGLNNLMKIDIPDISVDQQKLIFNFLNKLEQKINNVKKIINKTEIYSEAIMPSVLAKAFNGEF